MASSSSNLKSEAAAAKGLRRDLQVAEQGIAKLEGELEKERSSSKWLSEGLAAANL